MMLIASFELPNSNMYTRGRRGDPRLRCKPRFRARNGYEEAPPHLHGRQTSRRDFLQCLCATDTRPLQKIFQRECAFAGNIQSIHSITGEWNLCGRYWLGHIGGIRRAAQSSDDAKMTCDGISRCNGMIMLREPRRAGAQRTKARNERLPTAYDSIRSGNITWQQILRAV